MELIRDTSRTQEWTYRSGGAEPIKIVNPHEHIIHTITRAPWPVSNRDIFLKAHYSQNAETLIVTIQYRSLDNYAPKLTDYIRMNLVEGSWTSTPKASNSIQVSHHMRADPGGSIPDWLAGASSIDTPFFTLKRMRKM
jgi:hypothetical protein